ncbi:choice-of-anchor V domain-containing protein [Tenacibaculum sp. 190524A02b]|uniref:choice-of-anchor V domain-containing protein n=1 Tax=Tenacibaculum vairaonense TaxID=3137860 RepID=UPI0031FAB1EB
MKKDYLFKLTLFALPVAAVLLLSFSGGRDSTYSGSPGDLAANGNNVSSSTCVQCHGGTASNSNVTVSTNIPVTGYEFNTEYEVTITSTGGGTRNGFQVTAEKDSDNAKVGTFASGGSDTKAVNSGQRATHTSGTNQSTWKVKWTSPSSDQGKVTFYAAVLAGNGNGGTSGDTTFTGSSNSTPSLGIAQENRLDFAMYPNPAKNSVKIDLPLAANNADVQIYDYTGKLIQTQQISSLQKEVNVQELPVGMYLLKIASGDKLGVKHFVKE